MAPNIAKPMMNPTPEAAVKVRFLNKPSGMIGSTAFDSTTQKATNSATPTTPKPDDQPRAPGVLGAAPRREQDDGGHTRRHEGGPEPVDLVRDAIGGDVEHRGRSVNRAMMPMGTLM